MPLRDEVIAFACAMEQELQENEHKGSWKNDNIFSLLERLREETDELELALKLGESPVVITQEAADVANFAMMIADRIGGIKLIIEASEEDLDDEEEDDDDGFQSN